LHPGSQIVELNPHEHQDPLTHARGYHEYAPQWYGLPKVFSHSETIEYRLLSSTHNPNRIIYYQTQQYTLRFFGTKYTLESIVLIGLDDDDMITKVEDKWSGNDHPTRYGAIVRVVHLPYDVYYIEMLLDTAKIDSQGPAVGSIGPKARPQITAGCINICGSLYLCTRFFYDNERFLSLVRAARERHGLFGVAWVLKK